MQKESKPENEIEKKERFKLALDLCWLYCLVEDWNLCQKEGESDKQEAKKKLNE